MKTIDACGLSCPEPVLLMRQGLEAGEFPFVVLVDDDTPRENILRYANNHGHATSVEDKDGIFHITFTS
ncbi:MAG: sulfurtransferase TusA family protein [Saccharofermentanales bacterium]|jgi:tRNA 2-thiouridine synthesizing protein A